MYIKMLNITSNEIFKRFKPIRITWNNFSIFLMDLSHMERYFNRQYLQKELINFSNFLYGGTLIRLSLFETETVWNGRWKHFKWSRTNWNGFFFSFLYYVHAVRKLREFLEETGQSFWVLVWKFFAIQKWKK